VQSLSEQNDQLAFKLKEETAQKNQLQALVDKLRSQIEDHIKQV
jgi:hypothetical protein